MVDMELDRPRDRSKGVFRRLAGIGAVIVGAVIGLALSIGLARDAGATGLLPSLVGSVSSGVGSAVGGVTQALSAGPTAVVNPVNSVENTVASISAPIVSTATGIIQWVGATTASVVSPLGDVSTATTTLAPSTQLGGSANSGTAFPPAVSETPPVSMPGLGPTRVNGSKPGPGASGNETTGGQARNSPQGSSEPSGVVGSLSEPNSPGRYPSKPKSPLRQVPLAVAVGSIENSSLSHGSGLVEVLPPAETPLPLLLFGLLLLRRSNRFRFLFDARGPPPG
jgi:hypothetical protein